MKGYYIKPQKKTIKEIVMFTKDVDLQSLINTVHLILGVDKIDGMMYNSYSFLFHRDQTDPHKKECRHWFKIEGNTEPKILFGSALIVLPLEKEITSFNIEFLDEYTPPIEDFKL